MPRSKATILDNYEEPEEWKYKAAKKEEPVAPPPPVVEAPKKSKIEERIEQKAHLIKKCQEIVGNVLRISNPNELCYYVTAVYNDVKDYAKGE